MPTNALPIIIFALILPCISPYRVTILVLPGFFNNAEDYLPLQKTLLGEGYEVDILNVERTDWLKVFSRGATDDLFWAGRAPPTNPGFNWYLDLVKERVQGYEEPCVLMGHSAGGWLARACLGDGSGNGDVWGSGEGGQLKKEDVAGIVTLGAPHYPPPDSSMEMTRGALTLTSELLPGCFHDDLFYMSVGGERRV